MKYQIMVKMLMLLLSRKKVNASYLAERYEISLRSVYRYIDELTATGIPIDVKRGRYGGIAIADTYRLPVGYFTKDEYTAAINALTAMSSQVSDDALFTALEKLKNQRRRDESDSLISGYIVVDGGTWCDTKNFSEKMSVCEKAVNKCMSLEIDYISRGGEHSRRVIDPHVLIFKQNVWYVYAFCHTKQEFRTFKIGRIKSAIFTGRTFEKQPITRADIPLNFTKNQSPLIPVCLEISAEALPDAEEWIGIDSIEPRANRFIAEVDLPDDSSLINKILSFGRGIKVLSPQDLRERVKLAAQSIIDEL